MKLTQQARDQLAEWVEYSLYLDIVRKAKERVDNLILDAFDSSFTEEERAWRDAVPASLKTYLQGEDPQIITSEGKLLVLTNTPFYSVDALRRSDRWGWGFLRPGEEVRLRQALREVDASAHREQQELSENSSIRKLLKSVSTWEELEEVWPEGEEHIRKYHVEYPQAPPVSKMSLDERYQYYLNLYGVSADDVCQYVDQEGE